MTRPSKRTTVLLAAGVVALGAGGATLGIAASPGSEPSHEKSLADALNKNEGTNLTEADIREAEESALKSRLDADVAAGRLTREQADEKLQHFKDGPKRRADFEARRDEGMAPVAKALGMTADDVWAKLRDGTSLAKLAEEKGVSRAKLLDAIKEGLRAATKDSGVTLSDERLNEMAERLADGTGPRLGRGGWHGDRGGPGPGGPFGP